MASRKKMTDEEIEVAALEALRTSLGGPDSEIGHLRLRNIEAYNGEPIGRFAPPEVEDRSDFVATDVADTVNGLLPNLMQMFVASDDAVEFEGRGQPGSQEEAKLATAYVNHLFYVRNDGVAVLHDWFWDALVQKVGFVKVWAEDESEDARQAYEGQTPEQLIMLLEEGWELEGEPEQDESGLSFTVVKKSRGRAIKVCPVAPHEMRVDVNARWDDEPAMIGHVYHRPRFEWIEDGFDLDDVPSGSRPDEMEALALLGDGEDSAQGAPHESHELVKGAEIYIKLDADGDGVAEWLKICLIEDRLARYTDGSPAWEHVDDHPFVWASPNPRPHTFFGDCPADQAYRPQLMRTRIVRAIDDGLFLSVNPRTYVNTSANVNIDDVLDNRPGGIIRGQGAAGDALTTIAQPNLAAPAYQFADFISSWREDRTGFNRYSAGTDANAINKTAQGTALLTAKADMRMGLMARHLSVAVRKLFAKILKLAVRYQNTVEMVKLNGEFVPINPSEFRNQFRVKINVGLGTGTKEQQAARIMAMLQAQMQVGVPMGIVGPEQVAESLKLLFEANEFKNPERFVSPEPQGPSPQMQQMQQQFEQQMQQAQQELQRLGMENMQLKLANRDKSDKTALDAERLALDTAERSAKLDLEAERVGLDAGKLELDAFAKVADLANPDRGYY